MCPLGCVKYSGHHHSADFIACYHLPLINSYAYAMAHQTNFQRHLNCVFVGGNSNVMHLWGEKAAPAVHSLHFGFSLGGMISAQVTRQFLQPISTNGNVTENGTLFEHFTMVNTNVTISTIPVYILDVTHTSQLVYPYSMASAFAVLMGILLITIHVKGTPNGFPKRQPKNKFCELLSPGSCAYGRQIYGGGILFLVFLFYVFTVGGEKAYGDFIFSYAVDADVSFSKGKAAHLLTLFFYFPSHWAFPWHLHKPFRTNPLAYIWWYNRWVTDNDIGGIAGI